MLHRWRDAGWRQKAKEDQARREAVTHTAHGGEGEGERKISLSLVT